MVRKVKYKNLVFDIGGVLLGYRWHDMLTDDFGLAPDKADAFGAMIFPDSLWLEFDLENIPYEEVMHRYMEKYPEWAETIEWFLTHSERMKVDRPAVWAEVHRLKEEGFRIYLLSNYSSVLLTNHTRGASFLKDIDGKVVSYEIHAIKPDPAIYEELFRRYELEPEECLFFDDREVNVEGARAAGMDAVHVTGEKMLVEYLKNCHF